MDAYPGKHWGLRRLADDAGLMMQEFLIPIPSSELRAIMAMTTKRLFVG